MKPIIEIKISTPIADRGPCVSIHWADAPKDVAIEEFDENDQAWTKICDGIHALLAALGPTPKGGWDVEFTCSDFSVIIEENLTQDEYRNRSKTK